MNAVDEKFVSEITPGLVLHTLHWGEPGAPPLVLLHGGGANAHWWDHLAPALADRYHVIGLDFRGHGDSDHPEALEVGAFNVDLEALCAHMGHPRLILVGHSMGAHVALDHAARFDDVRGLVVIDPSRGGTRRSRRAARLALALRRDYASRDEAVDRFRFVPGAAHCEESLRRAIAEQSVREERNGRFGFKFDPRWFGVASKAPPDLGAIEAPTLVVRGEESEILSGEGARELAALIREARLCEIPGAGHHVLLDRPRELLAALSGWLDELPD